MKLLRLRAVNFAGIREVDIEFGPGLNVLYGPNELGKSTLVSAIRLALLLPHASSHCEPYIGWTGGADPLVDLTFETGPQRIWRIEKRFSKTGSSVLRESKNGREFDEVVRGRQVDAKLREILNWGIPEPGGAGSAKSFPKSFLATALLSTQADVGALLEESLQNDLAGTGKDRIAAALQAVAQDPLFVALLKTAQAERDSAYTDKGAKKTAKGSPFKDAAERLNEARKEKENLQSIVSDSEGAEKHLRELTNGRDHKQHELALATDLFKCLERLATQATDRFAAAEHVRLANDDVLRIRKIGNDVDAAELEVARLVGKRTAAEQTVIDVRTRQAEADAALKAAEETARLEEGSDPGLTDTVIRQKLELRKSAANQAVSEAQQRIDAVTAAQKLVNAVTAADADLQEQLSRAANAGESWSNAAAREKTAIDALHQCDLLERALDVQAAEKQLTIAKAAVDNETALRVQLDAVLRERTALAETRAAITAPVSTALPAMRRLATEIAGARGALDVGFVVTMSPDRELKLQVRKDGSGFDSTSTVQPLEIEANTEVEIAIPGIATVNVRGGRREAQKKAQALEQRWSAEVAPHLVAAGVADLDGLGAKVVEAQELDGRIKGKDTDTESLRARIAGFSGAADTLREASKRAKTCRTALGDVPLESLAADLKKLGADAIAGLRKQRQKLSSEVEDARTIATGTASAHTIAEERARNSRLVLDVAVSARDAALAGIPAGLAGTLAGAQADLAAGVAEQQGAKAEFASLESLIAERKKRIDAVLGSARANAEKAKAALTTAQSELTAAITGHASQDGRLIELKRLRDAENLLAAETRLKEAIERHGALPVPDRAVTNDEIVASENNVARMKLDLDALERDIQRAHGALEQVGGAVARERLNDATEAFELAEHHERETEAEYEAWKLLLEQMKGADADQASNLGLALAPAIAGRFRELTQQRYETVQLTAQLGTDGVIVAGTVRSTTLMSVGTREQLSTLYRLSLAEYLRTVIVLDDQLVQSDETRMDWFRALLAEKARSFQILVFTCRPSDYLAASALVPHGSAFHVDDESGFIRAVDLGRMLRRSGSL